MIEFSLPAEENSIPQTDRRDNLHFIYAVQHVREDVFSINYSAESDCLCQNICNLCDASKSTSSCLCLGSNEAVSVETVMSFTFPAACSAAQQLEACVIVLPRHHILAADTSELLASGFITD